MECESDVSQSIIDEFDCLDTEGDILEGVSGVT